MNRGIKFANKLSTWLFDLCWGRLDNWKGTVLWHLFHFVMWFAPAHTFNPWRCEFCAFEARCGYESADEREIADRWRAENPDKVAEAKDGE